MKIKRYRHSAVLSYPTIEQSMVFDTDGAWCRYEDHEAEVGTLKQRIKEFEAELVKTRRELAIEQARNGRVR